MALGAVVLIFAFELGSVSKWLRRPVFTGLGSISYSLYLTHSVYLLGLETAANELAAGLGKPVTVVVAGNEIVDIGGIWSTDLAAIVCVAVALVGSSLTYRGIEEPARRFFNRLSTSAAPPAGH
jgi:peptidoglycan/LPS O-acetylase OafA/YrhL